MKKLDLNGRWQFKAINAYGSLPPGRRRCTRWMDGTVPGTVHTDLMANGEIPDPFYRMNELEVQWVDSQKWLYRRKFRVPRELIGEEAVSLVARGLDTYAELRINGRRAGNSANMFIEQRFDVKKFLRAGENTLEILFDSPTVRSKRLERSHGALRVACSPHRVYVRKAQYSFGWDWGPTLATSGIWRDIFIEAYSVARLGDVFVKVLSVRNYRALVRLSAEVERTGNARLRLRVCVAGGDARVEQTVSVRGTSVKLTLEIPRPRLWWPNGSGDQPMYVAVVSLLHEGSEVHEREVPFAIRSVRLIQKKDARGKSFIVQVNGRKIYCKGANWIPCDSFLPRIPPSTYQRLLEMAAQAHMNMLRVWGGGIYEQDLFYDLCDRLGLMVWQDFMYACGEYPESPPFVRSAEDEAKKVVRRLRNHPSIVLWCGNNECEWVFCTDNPSKRPDQMRGSKIFREILPGVCRREDGTRPYWRSSPWGVGFPNAESDGNHHQWTVWGAWRDFKEYESDLARFVTEFGFQSPANRTTFEGVTRDDDRQILSAVMEHHNKLAEGTERLFRFQAAHYRVGESFDDFIYRGQLVQAEALKCAVEHWRRRKFATAGSLFWQLNDCWPVSSWSAIDSALRPKAVYYFAKKFFAPVLVSFRRGKDHIEIWGTSDLRGESFSGRLHISLCSFSDGVVWDRSVGVTLAPNSSRKIAEIDPAVLSDADPAGHYLHARMLTASAAVPDNRYYFVEPKHLRLPSTIVAVRMKGSPDGHCRLELRAGRFAKNVRIELEGEDVLFDDNYFDLDRGSKKTVSFLSHSPIRILVKKLRLKWL